MAFPPSAGRKEPEQALQQSPENTFEAKPDRWIDVAYHLAALSDGDSSVTHDALFRYYRHDNDTTVSI